MPPPNALPHSRTDALPKPHRRLPAGRSRFFSECGLCLTYESSWTTDSRYVWQGERIVAELNRWQESGKPQFQARLDRSGTESPNKPFMRECLEWIALQLKEGKE
jgi:hypothetical protein